MTLELPKLESREDYIKEAKRLKALAFRKYVAADVRRTWDSFTKQSSESKRDVKVQLQNDLQFLDELCRSDGHASIFKEDEVVIRDIDG
tara:strand:- start:943 stop:1209 length:267 start_codon:yes stop_codon:yes gene_type:complete